MCEIPKMLKTYNYKRDKMEIIQNEVVWNQNIRGGGGGGGRFRYAVNFAIMEKISLS